MTHGALYFFAAVMCSFALGMNTANIIFEEARQFACWLALLIGVALFAAAWVVG